MATSHVVYTILLTFVAYKAITVVRPLVSFLLFLGLFLAILAIPTI
jgi:hypothetical protein